MKKWIIFFFFSMTIINAQTKIQVINKGIPGDNTVNLLDRIESDVMTYEPDLVIMMVGTNDFCNDRKFINADQYEKNLDLLIDKIINQCDLVLLTILPIEWDKLFERHNRNLYPADYEYLVEKCNNIIRARKQERVHILDIYKYFQKIGDDWLMDGVHQNSHACQVMASVIYQYIQDNFDVDEIKTIVCFGNSITASVLLEKKYPDYLKILMNQ